MSVEAKASKYSLKTLKIYIFAAALAAVVFGYDGYCSKYEWSKRTEFHNKHVVDGVADATMSFNYYAPPALLILAGWFAFQLVIKGKKKVVAGDADMDICGEVISYDSIEKIDKTHFDSKGYFVFTYKNEKDVEQQVKLSDRDYDGLNGVLDKIVEKIS